MNKIKSLLAILLISIVSLGSYAQTAPTPPSCPTNPNNKVGGPGPAGTPLEDGVWITLALAFLYGAYEIRKSLKKTKEPAMDDNR